MQLTYQKLGKDHPMYGQVECVVADGMKPLCYKTAQGYRPIADEQSVSASDNAVASASVETRPLYVLAFKVNDEMEEMTFTSKKKLEKTQQALQQKAFVTEIKLTTYQVMA